LGRREKYVLVDIFFIYKDISKINAPLAIHFVEKGQEGRGTRKLGE